MGVIGRAIRSSGLDDRFMLFVTGTMALSVLASVAGAAVAELSRGDAEAAAATVFTGLIGAGMVFGPMLVVGLLVSIPVFAIVWRLAGGEAALPVAAEYAGGATAGAATILWVALLTVVNGDGAEYVVGIVGIVAVLVAPRVARWAYQDKSSDPAPRPDAPRGSHDAS